MPLLAVLRGSYDLSEQDVMRNRVLVAEQGLVGVRRTSPREEEARTLARARIRDIEFTWATFLVRGMEQGILPEADPRLMTRALLGLYNSIWHWYRPHGAIEHGRRDRVLHSPPAGVARAFTRTGGR